MKKLAIISVTVGFISVALTIGFLILKLNNNNLFDINALKVISKTENKKDENKKTESKKIEDKPKEKKIETKVKQANKVEYTDGKAPDFKGYKQTEVYEFAKEHGIKYELGQAVLTPVYNLKGTVANQSIEPGKSIPKDETLEINIYIFDGHYDPTKESDQCHDKNGNLIKK